MYVNIKIKLKKTDSVFLKCNSNCKLKAIWHYLNMINFIVLIPYLLYIVEFLIIVRYINIIVPSL